MTQIETHMQLIEQAIGRTFVDNGLPVHLLGGVQGPHTLTFGLRLYQATATNLGKAQKLATAVEATLGDGPVRIVLERGVVWVETPSPVATPVPGWQLEGQELAIPLGLTSRCTVAGVDFAQDPHLLLVGPTGRGKTTAARAVAYHLARQNVPQRLRFVAVTFKPQDWLAFGQLSHSLALVTDPEEALQLLTWLTTLMQRRAAEGRVLPRLVIFLDDLLNLLALVDVVGPLTELASLGRGAGIHLVIATQRLGKRGAGDAAVTGNIPVRLVFGTADAQDASFFTGRGKSGAECLGRYKGDALLITDGGTTRLAVSPVEDSDLARLPQDSAEIRPWLGNGQAATRTIEPRTVRDEGGLSAPRTTQNQPVLTGSAGSSGSPPVQPFLDRAPHSTDEVAHIQAIYAATRSKSETCRLVWGYKNGEVWGWMEEALSGQRSAISGQVSAGRR